MSEMLKKNTTLTSLNLNGEKEEGKNVDENEKRTDEQLTDNRIGFEGAKSMSEMLKTNTTLTSLDMRCEE